MEGRVFMNLEYDKVKFGKENRNEGDRLEKEGGGLSIKKLFSEQPRSKNEGGKN